MFEPYQGQAITKPKLRLQCNVCGARSATVASMPPTALEGEMLAGFRAQHDATCAVGIGFPNGATSVEMPIIPCGPFGSDKPEPVSTLRPHGYFEYTGPYGETQVGETLSCCHCSTHWEVRKGSGKRRGYCAACGESTCGEPACDECWPRGLREWNAVHGLPERTRPPLLVAVPELPPDLTHLRTTITTED